MSFIKQTIVSLAAVFLSAVALGQTTPSTSTASPSQTPSATTTPAIPPSQPAGTKRPPQATSAEEYAAYKSITTQTSGAAVEAALKDFEAKFPKSELRPLLYYSLMHGYQEGNDADKAIAMGRRSVELDADNPVTLIELANLIAEGTRDTDLDREPRYTEAVKYAKHGMETMETSLVVPPNTPPEKVQQLKQFLAALAHAALGLVDFNHHNDVTAEQHLRESARLNTIQPDPMVYLRLAIALDHQSKYQDALAAANRVLELTPNGPLANLAHSEKDRLQKLMGTGPVGTMGATTTSNPAAPAKPATNPPPTAPATQQPQQQPQQQPPKS